MKIFRRQLTGIREVGRSVHIYVTNKKDLRKVDTGQSLWSLRPSESSGNVWNDQNNVATTRSAPNSRGERALCVRAPTFTLGHITI